MKKRNSLIAALMLIASSAFGQSAVVSAGGSAGGGSGTVTSVGVSGASGMSVTGSPITSSGTIALAWSSQSQGTVLAGPCSGAGVAVFRSLCAADIPAIPESGVTGLVADLAAKGTVSSVALTSPGVVYTVSGSPVTTSGTLALNLVSQSANTVLAGPTSGGSTAPTFRALVAADMPYPQLSATTDLLSIKRTTNPQTVRIFNTDDGAGNAEYYEAAWAANAMFLRTAKTGTGTNRNLIIDSGSGSLYFQTGGTTRMYVDSLGNLTTLSSSSLGQTGTLWQNEYLAISTQGGIATALTNNTATNFQTISLASGARTGGKVLFNVDVTNGTALQSSTGELNFAAVNAAGTITVTLSTPTITQALSSGTDTITFDATTTSTTFTLRCTSNTSVSSPTTHRIQWRNNMPSVASVAPL